MDRIKYSRGLTINLGNYESERIDVGVEMDVHPEDNVSDIWIMAFEAVESRIRIKVDEIRRRERERKNERKSKP